MPIILHCGPRMMAPLGSALRGPKPSKWTRGGRLSEQVSVDRLKPARVFPDDLVELAL